MIHLIRHAERDPPRRPALGPIRTPWEQEDPDDPHGLRAKRPANFGVPTQRRPTDEPPGSRRARPARAPATTAALLRTATVALELLVAAAVAVHLGVLALTAPGRPGEAFGTARVVAAVRPDMGEIPGAWPGRMFGSTLAVWLSATGALARHPTALTAVREGVLVAAFAMIALTWSLTRRMRLSAYSRIVAILLLGAVPTSAALLSAVRPGTVAAAAVTAATALVAGARVGTVHRLLAMAALGLAVIVVPAALPGLLAGVAVLVGQGGVAGRLAPGLRRPLAIAVGLVAAALLGLVLFGPQWIVAGLVSTSPAPPPVPGLVEVPVLLCVLGLSAEALGQRWLRAPALAAVVLLASGLLLGGARGDLFTVALPLLAIVTVAGAEDRLANLGPGGRRWGRTWRLSARRRATVTGVAALAAAAVLAGSLANLPARPTSPAVREASAYVADELPGDPLLLVDDALWPELLRAGVPATRMRTVVGRGAPGEPRWRVTAGDVNRDGAVAMRWLPYAVFGERAARVTVLRHLPDPVVGTDFRSVRARMGAELAENSRLSFAPDAVAALRRGDVDVRLILVLAQLSAGNRLGVAEFVRTPGESAGELPLRRVLISTVDDRPARTPQTVELVANWLNGQIGPYKPASTVLTINGLLVRYALVDTPI